MKQKRILIIDDDAVALDFLTYGLERLGFETIPAAGGAEGIGKALAEKPDLILCDILMPRPDGYEVRQRLAGEPATAAIPVLAVTALAMAGDREKVLEAGFNSYISKPVELEDLGRAVRHFLANGEMRSAGPEPPPRRVQ